jgi:hypothetical protein
MMWQFVLSLAILRRDLGDLPRSAPMPPQQQRSHAQTPWGEVTADTAAVRDGIGRDRVIPWMWSGQAAWVVAGARPRTP